MKKAVFLTAYNRLDYLRQTLETWKTVRGQEDWHFVAMIEPYEGGSTVVRMFEDFFQETNWGSYLIHVNPQRYGVLHHPWVGFENLFNNDAIGQNYDFVLRAEDDLLVSDDILEFFSWAAETYQDNKQVATVHSFSHGEGDPADVVLSDGFSPWIWGTWQDRWMEYLGPTWDHDYSTFNGHPGNQSGWDWNINTRLFPKMNLRSVVPVVSRSDNIGVFGTHGTAENFVRLPDFQQHQPRVSYRGVDTTRYEHFPD